jgi:hypothetical protein
VNKAQATANQLAGRFHDQVVTIIDYDALGNADDAHNAVLRFNNDNMPVIRDLERHLEGKVNEWDKDPGWDAIEVTMRGGKRYRVEWSMG